LHVDDQSPRVNAGYALDQLSRALRTALTHEDGAVRDRARARSAKWTDVLRGISSGRLRVGSRTPVTDFPVWVTPEVVRGGFATGSAAAAGPLELGERELAKNASIPATRESLFEWYLSEAGLGYLADLLASKTYRVELPEEAALLVMTWLGCAGGSEDAVRLIQTIAAYADRIRFAPASTGPPIGDLDIVYRETAGDVAAALERRSPNERVEAMREAIEVWAPFGDELLGLFLRIVSDGEIPHGVPNDWLADARQLLDRYSDLAAVHTRCTKHRKPKENVAILVSAAGNLIEGRGLSDRERGLVRSAVAAMVARRGVPGSEMHRLLRAAQAHDVAQPSHARVAHLVAHRIRAMPADRGIADVDGCLGPLGPTEARGSGLSPETSLPEPVIRIVRRATTGTAESLIERGVVPSAEVLAQLVPRITAQAVARVYPEPTLAGLMAANYLAFRRRRTLLLLNLEHQVRVHELPWVAAVAGHRRDDVSNEDALLSIRRIGELAVGGFPGTILPNTLVRELDSLSRESALRIPFVEELAADIFMGTFSPKFLTAAHVAADLLSGTIYERYYGIDYERVSAMRPTPADAQAHRPATAGQLAAYSQERAGRHDGWSVAANGTVIEQAQILTTHNLATLFGPVGLRQALDAQLESLALHSFERALDLIAKTERNPRPLGHVKDAAYAWRQMVFYLAMLGGGAVAATLQCADERAENRRPYVRERAAHLLAGLAEAATGGGASATTGVVPRPFIGWSVGRHWLLSDDLR
jgi:hypothetical protein